MLLRTSLRNAIISVLHSIIAINRNPSSCSCFLLFLPPYRLSFLPEKLFDELETAIDAVKDILDEQA